MSDKGYEFHWAPYSEAPTMTRPNGHVITLCVRDECPHLDDFDGREKNNAISADPAQADSQSLRQGREEPRLHEFRGVYRSGSRILKLLQEVLMAKSARRLITGGGIGFGLAFKDQPFNHPQAKSC